MNLHDQLKEILPAVLPRREEDAIKGTELIARVRKALGKEQYSDGTLRTQFSLLALEEDTCLARVPGGQGYYMRRDGEPLQGLHELMRDTSAETPLHRAIAVAIRLYDTTGQSVFAYPIAEESWGHPDLVAVHWPTGCWSEDGCYHMTPRSKKQSAAYRAVCVSLLDDEYGVRRDFFRALSCGEWAEESELLMVGNGPKVAPYAAKLGTRYGVGVRMICTDPATLPPADELLRMDTTEAQALLARLPQSTFASPEHRTHPLLSEEELPDVQPVLQWAQQCVQRGRVEAYERRVAVN